MSGVFGYVLGNKGRRKKSSLGNATRVRSCVMLHATRCHLDFILWVIRRYQGLKERSLKKGTDSFNPPLR